MRGGPHLGTILLGCTVEIDIDIDIDIEIEIDIEIDTEIEIAVLKSKIRCLANRSLVEIQKSALRTDRSAQFRRDSTDTYIVSLEESVFRLDF